MRTVIQNLQESKIREVANAGLGRADVLPFWFGESDEVTPDFIRRSAVQSLEAGETFYSQNLGLPQLRDEVAAYMSALHLPVDGGRIAITSGGVNGLMLAAQALVDPGDHVVAVAPVWPNLVAQSTIMGGAVEQVPLRVHAGQWTLDMDAFCAVVTSRTRVLLINAPNNPTGWTLTRAEQEQILAHCRVTGTWIVADEVYERLYYETSERGCAPSFLDIAAPQDRLVVVHSFSKSFLMTGWRLGWMVLPHDLAPHIGKLIEFNTSCTPLFVQRAAITALQRQAEVTPRIVQHLKLCRDTLVPLLQAMPQVEVSAARGGMYAYFSLAGAGDSLATAKRLVVEAGLGLAPGAAFGLPDNPHGPSWLRWCFASRDPQRLVLGAQRLGNWLATAAP